MIGLTGEEIDRVRWMSTTQQSAQGTLVFYKNQGIQKHTFISISPIKRTESKLSIEENKKKRLTLRVKYIYAEQD